MKSRTVEIVALLLAFSLLPAQAQQASPQPAPKLNDELLKPLPAPLVPDTGKFRDDKSDSGGLSLPDKIDLGKSVLHFDTNRGDSSPRIGVDTTDSKVLYSGVPTHKDSAPRYFGLRLTKPTQ